MHYYIASHKNINIPIIRAQFVDDAFSGFNHMVVSIVVADNLVVGSSLAVIGLSLMAHTVNLWQSD